MAENPSAEFLDQAAPLLRTPDIWLLPAMIAAVAVIVAAPLGLLLAHLAAGRLRRARAGDADLPWYETARLAFPLRRSLSFANTVIPLVACLAGRLLVWPVYRPIAWCSGLLAFALTRFVLLELTRKYEGWIRQRPLPYRVWRRDVRVYSLLFTPHLYIMVLGLAFIPRELGGAVVVILALLAVPWWALAHRSLGISIMRWLRLLRPAGERLQSIGERAEEDTGIKAFGFREIRWSQANAFMLPRTGEVAVTEGALGALSDDETHAIICHELGHVADIAAMRKHRAIASWAAFPLVAAPLLIVEVSLSAFIAVYAVTLFIIAQIQKRVRLYESRADDQAIGGSDPDTYAKALAKLYEHMLAPAVTRRSPLKTHPDLYDRLMAVGETPGFPRPDPPQRGPLLAFLLPTGLAIALLSGLLSTPARGYLGSPMSGKSWLLPVAWRDPEWRAEVLRGRAQQYARRGDRIACAKLLRAVAFLPGRDWEDLAAAAEASLAAGEVDMATRFTGWAASEYFYTISKVGVPERISLLQKKSNAS